MNGACAFCGFISIKHMDKKIFGTLFFSIFAAVMGVGIVVPLLPIYARELGAGGMYIGLVFGAFSLSRTVFLPYFGRLSDKKGRKPFIVAGLLAYALISLLFIYTTNIHTLIFLRFVQGIASAMIMPVVMAYVGDITPEGLEGFAMGLFNMSIFFGLSIGPLIGGVIKDTMGLQSAFSSMSLLALTGFFLSLFLLPPTKTEKVMGRSQDPMSWKIILKDTGIVGLFLFRFAYTSCIGMIWGFLPVFADAEFSLPSSSIGILAMMAVFVSGVIHTPMGMLADRMNKKIMVVSGGILAAWAIFSFTWTVGFWDLFWANVLFGLGGGISMPALMALAVLKGGKTASMGTVMAMLTMAHSLGMLTGAMIAGVIMETLKLRQAFPIGSILMLTGVVLFVLCPLKEKYAPRTQP